MIHEGDHAPTFELASEPGVMVDLEDHLGEEKIVLLFYPLAFSGVCTTELCSIRNMWPEFESLGARVFGISVDSPFVTKRYRESEGLPFPLLSDFNKDVSAEYGVLEEEAYGLKGISKRSAFVIGTDGVVVYAWVAEDSGVEPDYEAIKTALAAAP